MALDRFDLLPTLTSPLFAALLAAHFIADFLLQTKGTLERKKRASGLVEHGVVHLLVSLALVAPLAWRTGGLAAATVAATGLAAAHIVIDAIKVRGPVRYRTSALGFTIDQALHFATIVGVALYFEALVHSADDGTYRRILLAVAALIAITRASMFFVALLVAPFVAEADTGSKGAGRTIGLLERLAIGTFVIAGQWGAAGFILAAKSLARFKDLDDRAFAEYYLVGTLGSVLAAVGIALGLRILW